MCAAALSPDQYINRELSWIAFNQRVLAQAIDQRTPLLDQAKFSAILAITSMNSSWCALHL